MREFVVWLAFVATIIVGAVVGFLLARHGVDPFALFR